MRSCSGAPRSINARSVNGVARFWYLCRVRFGGRVRNAAPLSEISMRLTMTLLLTLLCTSFALAQEQAKPLKALLITGGCCHDYERQKKILSEGISARANVEWTVVHEGEGPKKGGTNHKISIYEKEDWAKGYDVVVHNECFADVNDVQFV